MKTQQAETLKSIEELIRQRFDLMKLYPVLSVEAMQQLEKSDTEAFNRKLDERGILTEQADVLSTKINALVAELDDGIKGIVTNLITNGTSHNDCPEWGKNIARNMERTYKLLQSCALFNERLLSCAKALQLEIHGQLGRIQAQRKINSLYAEQNAVPHGAHIHFSSK